MHLVLGKVGILECPCQPADMNHAQRSDDAELRQVSTQRADRLRALAHQKVARVRNSIALACCFPVFTATKRMVGRCAA